AAAPAAAQQPVPKHPDRLTYPPLPELDPPQPERVVLDNGMVVMLIEDHELPLVEATALIRTGARLEPADEIGLAQLTGTVLRSGGTRSMPSEELNQFLENRAASIETSIGTTFGSASMSALKEDFPAVLAAFADVLREPAFEADKLEVAKNAMIAGIARQNDNPQQIAFRELAEIVYGEDSPYARNATYATVAAVDRDDLVAWHQRYYHPERVILGLVGDFERDEALALVRQEFGDWARGPETEDPDAAFDAAPDPGVYFAEKADMTQSNILIGHLGIRRDDPDYYAVEVLNNVLSGGFASRLFSEIRSRRGLAYAVFGGVGSDFDHPGLFQMFMTTKVETTAESIQALLDEAKKLTSKPPTPEEVAKAKQSILASFVFESDSTREVLGQQMRYEYFGYPLDWLERYQAGIEATTVDQVRAAAAEHVHPERFSILVVGPGEGMDKPLSTFGEVVAVDISIPEPEVERAEVTAEGQEQALQLLDRAVEAMGGAAVDAARALRISGTVGQQTPQGEMEIQVAEIHVFPDRFRQEVTLPFGSMTMVLTGDAGFAITPQGVVDIPGSRLAALRQNASRNVLALLKARRDPELVATTLAAGEIDGTPIERLQLEIAGDVTVVGLDPETGRVRRIEYHGMGPGGAPGQVVETYSDWREVDGLQYPFAIVGTFDGQEVQRVTLDEVEVDPEVDESAFARPEAEQPE
ncbi:MAG TPA: pitrilysin family protein, partial [Thermoanaerobaculia bacterium]|nr:pitrilysin family protein [Thermoanaerobaculia bacterium]